MLHLQYYRVTIEANLIHKGGFAMKYGIPDGKKRVALTLTEEEVRILQEVSKRYRRTMSATIGYIIEVDLKHRLEMTTEA